MKKNLETIRHACIAANDQIMDLGFGCEVKVKYTNLNPRKVATKVFEIGDGKDFVYLASNTGMEGEMVYLERYKPSDNFIQEILGRPIRLADVLIAVSKNCKASKKVSDSPEWMVVTHWDLFKDDLNNQSKEFVAVLAGLLPDK